MSPENYESRQKVTSTDYVPELLKKAKGKILIIGLNGSNEGEGRTREFLSQVLTTVEDQGGFSVLVDLSKVEMAIPSGKFGKKGPEYQPERRNDDVEDLRTLVRNADALVFATPTYWFSKSGLLQTFIEHLTPLEDYGELEGKAAGLIVTEDEEGASMVIAQLMITLTHMGMVIAPYSGIFSRGPGRDYRWVQEDVGQLGTRMVALIKATRGVDWDTPDGTQTKKRPQRR